MDCGLKGRKSEGLKVEREGAEGEVRGRWAVGKKSEVGRSKVTDALRGFVHEGHEGNEGGKKREEAGFAGVDSGLWTVGKRPALPAWTVGCDGCFVDGPPARRAYGSESGQVVEAKKAARGRAAFGLENRW